jgi:hypothetical protein
LGNLDINGRTGSLPYVMRQAWFGVTPIPIGNRDPQANPWTNIIVYVSGLVACVVLAWWVITRYTAISG